MNIQASSNGSFVTVFPYEVLGAIFSQLSFQECIKSTRVCCSWRSFLFNWSELWYELSDLRCNFERDLEKYQQWLPWRHVRIISVKASSIKFVNVHVSTSIRTAFLRGEYTVQDIHRFCKSAGSNLSILRLEHGFRNPLPELALDTILTHCPRLTQLTYRSSWDSSFIPSLSTAFLYVKPHPMLQSLEIDFANILKLDDFLLRLVRILPNLRRIRLNPRDYHDAGLVLAALAEFCPLVDTVALTEDSCYRWHNQQNLVCFRGVGRVDRRHLMTFLQPRYQTVQTLDLLLYTDSFATSMLTALSALGPQLRRLSLTAGTGCYRAQEVCAFIMEKSPLLEHVELARFEFGMEACLQRLVNLEHLQSLKLFSCGLVTPMAMTQFLRKTRSQKMLKNVYLDSIPAVTNEVLGAIGQYLAVLERLYIGRCSYVKDSGVRSFVDRFEGRCLREVVFCHSAFGSTTAFSKDTMPYAQSRFGTRVIIKEITC